MSAYKGARGVNVSQYVQQLNRLSPVQQPLDEAAPSGDDFSAFLNDEFYDVNNINGGPLPDFDVPILDTGLSNIAQQSQQSHSQPGLGHSSRKHSIQTSADPNMDFNLGSDFNFTDFSSYGPTPLLDPSLQGLPQAQPGHFPLLPNYGSPTSPTSPGYDQSTKKRKLDDVAAPQNMDEGARVAAEEDKRRRNTAASARFRVKKKQREQALEQNAKEMQDKATRLEQKVQQLETENAWLKGLITEKSGGTTRDLKALLSKHEEASGRSSPTHTEGVGTKA